MTTTDVISPDLKAVLRRLKLSRMLDTLPERLTLARQQKMPHQDLLLQVLSDEATRRDSLAVTLRVQNAHLDPAMRLDAWDATAKVTFDRALLNELATLRFLDAHAHVTIVGPVGVGKTLLAHALGHIACRRGATVLAVRTDQMLTTLKHARLDHSYEAALRTFVAVDRDRLDFSLQTALPDREAASRLCHLAADRTRHQVSVVRTRGSGLLFQPDGSRAGTVGHPMPVPAVPLSIETQTEG